MKKRILIFSTAYLPLVGGAEIAAKEITDRLSDFEFVMITAKIDPRFSDVEKIGNITVYRIGHGNNFDKIRLIFDGPKKAQELGKFDAVWSIMASYAGFASLRFKKQNSAVPYLLTLQEGDSRWDIYKHIWWCWPYFKQIFKRADKIQAISNYLADWAKDLGAKCPIEVVPNGVDIAKFQPTVVQNSVSTVIQSDLFLTEFTLAKRGKDLLFKSNLSIPRDAKIVITASRLVKKNGISDLIKAVKFLKNNTHLLILGTGELEEKLKLASVQDNVVKRVHFLGNIHHDELSRYLQISDVFCRPSRSEGLGNVFLEAMAAGVPVVGTKIGGIPDFLKNEETGLFCEVNNPKDIAEKINIMLNNQELKNKLITNGKKLIAEKYSWDIVVDKMKSIFVDLCKKEF